MSFQQMYFTSCEHGLLGVAGFQFNAVTEATSPETMRRVEALTSYDPPRDFATPQTPEELARCPVNLCFESGPTTILARTQYVGRDSSRRFGNYFAHALATADLDAEDTTLLPIELWRSPCWQSQPSRSTTLPTLDGPLPPGPLNRDEAIGFLRRHPHRGQLITLLSAVDLGRRVPGRPVLLVGATSDEVARWLAVISYLLPPRWVRGLSFATYVSRPSLSRLPVLGTVPEAHLDLGTDAAERFYLFDFPGARFARVPEHPLATLCAGIGIRDLPALWDWVNILSDQAREAPDTLDGWHPIVSAAAALGSIVLTEADLSAAIGWLRGAGRLEPGTQAAIARALYAHPALTTAHRHVIRQVADRSGDRSLWEQVLYEVLEDRLLGRTDGAASHAELTHAGAGPVRERLTARAEADLGLDATPPATLALLDWIGQAGLDLRTPLLIGCGRTSIGPLLAADRPARPLSDPLGGQARRVMARWPALRAGVVRYLESLPDLEASAALSGITGELLTEQDTGHNRRLRTQVVVSSALRRGEKPLPILTGLLNRNEPTSIDDALLAQLWRNQDSTVTDAYQVLKLASPAGLGGALSWLDRALSRPPGTPEEFRQYTSVCQQLMDSPLRTRLAEARMPTAGERGGTRYRVLGDIAYVYAVSSSASTVGDLADVIDSMAGGSPSVPAQALATTLIAPKAATLPVTATPQATLLLLQMLRLMPAPAVECYLESLQHRIGRGDRDLPAHVAAIWLFARTTPESGQHGGWITRLLGIAARDWPSSQQARAGKLIDTIDWDQASRFATWIDEHRVGLLRRMVRGAFATIREVGHRPREAREATAMGRGRLALPPKPFETDNR